jgi:hypothetical protein
MTEKADVQTLVTGLATMLAMAITLYSGQVCAASVASPSRLVAEVNQRVEMDHFEIRVYQGKRLVQLPSFMELLVITPLRATREAIDDLAGRSIAIVPPERRSRAWGVYLLASVGLAAAPQPRVLEARYRANAAQLLFGNIFVVKRVLMSSRRSPVTLRVDGHIIDVKPGDALLVL